MASGNRLQDLRERQDWSRRELADRLRPQPRGALLHERTIGRWETGKSNIPDGRKAELADLFGVSISHLMGWDDDGANGNGERRAA